MEEKIDITGKTIEIDTGKGSAIKVTMSYGQQSTLEELLIAYLEQHKTYEHVLACMQENIEKQKAAVSKMADVDVPEVAGLEMLGGQLKLTGLNREMVDTFVEEIVLYAKDRVEIKWKF